MSELTDKQLEDWLVRASHAGPWRPWQHGPTAEATADEVTAYMRSLYEAGGVGPVHAVHDGGPDGEALIVAITGNGERSKANAEFIAWSSPSNVSLALNEIRRLRRELADLRAATPPPDAGVLTVGAALMLPEVRSGTSHIEVTVDSLTRRWFHRYRVTPDRWLEKHERMDGQLVEERWWQSSPQLRLTDLDAECRLIPASPSESKEQP